jgi:hypothetical protein
VSLACPNVVADLAGSTSRRERGLSFKDAVNEAIRAGLAAPGTQAYTTPRDLGPARVDLTKALEIAGQLEDDALARRLAEGR